MLDYVQPLIYNRIRHIPVGWNVYLALQKYRERHGINNKNAYGLLVFFILFALYFWRIDNCLPVQMAFEKEVGDPERFVGERAEWFLGRLAIHRRKYTAHCENELTIELLHRDIALIKKEAQSIHKIRVDTQTPIASYYLTNRTVYAKNYYDHVKNVVVKFSSVNSSSDSLLLNCHFDTAPERPGAVDNGLNCAVLLETLYKLSGSLEPVKNTIIFVFHGTEENTVQASYSFITKQKWWTDVKAVINLDSAGGGGREVLFQAPTGSSWLIKTYAKVAPHSIGGVHTEELFLSGIFPHDTDFRIFKTFGKVPGLEFARIGNGHVYHKRFDKVGYTDPGVVQNTGDNILALVKEIAQTPDLGKISKKEKDDKTRVVYFDLFGKFMVVYSQRTGFVLNLCTAVFSIFTICKAITLLPASVRSYKKLLIATKQQLMGWIFSGLLITISAKIADRFNASMSWYNKPWIIMPIYLSLFIFANAFVPVLDLGKLRGIRAAKRAILYLIGMQLIWTAVLIVGTIMGYRSSFLIMFLVLSAAIASALSTKSDATLNARKYIDYNLALTILPVLYVLHQTVRLFTTIIPMTGRMGPQGQPEQILAIMIFLMAAPMTSYLIPLILILKKPKRFIFAMFGFHIFSLMAIVYTSSEFPCYTNSCPYNDQLILQQFYVMHTERTFYDRNTTIRKTDSGYFVDCLERDTLNYVARVFPELRDARVAALDCQTDLNCGTPVYSARNLYNAPFGYWVDAYVPIFYAKTDLAVTSEVFMNNQEKRINFRVLGPEHINIIISPKPGIRLVRWVLDNEEPLRVSRWKKRNIYMMTYAFNVANGVVEFGVDIESKKNLTSIGPVLEIVVMGHYVNHRNYNKEYDLFLTRFPKWVRVTSWAVSYKSYII